jgi:hypothetical protein
MAGYAYSSSTDFTFDVNSNDTILRASSASTAADESFVNATGSDSSTYSINELVSEVEYEASTLDFVTDLVIGSNGSTNLVREGSSLISKGNVNYSNDGLADADAYGSMWLSESVVGADISVVSGTELSTYSLAGGGETVQFKLDVPGEAGDVLDYNSINIGQYFTNGDSAYADSTKIQIDKNLITYQADINYDGRVSMMDLATLNAAASAEGQLQNGERGIASVDVDHSGYISISDLAKMDEQWGSSLHTGNDMDGSVFTGNDEATIDLAGTYIGDAPDTTDNSIFINQNDIENTDGFTGSLVVSTTSLNHNDANQFYNTELSEIVEV